MNETGMQRFSYGPSCGDVIVACMAALMLVLSCAAQGADAAALPTDGRITAGSGAISSSGHVMTVTQDTDRMITQWRDFDIGSDSRVDFLQPGASSVVLNRVVGGNPSQILGTLTANGRVYLLNPAGILFGYGAQVDVGALVAATLDMSDDDFLNGRDSFSNGGAAGDVLNQGKLNGRIVALIAPQVRNQGAITAANGSVVLAAGDRVSLDFVGDNLLNVSVDKAALAALADNQGLIQADGGRVVMTAKSAGDLMATVVNNDGVIQAKSLVERDGRILLDGGDAGITRVGGTLDVSSDLGHGGGITVTGDKLLVDGGARLDARGAQGGGEILVGGAWQGAGAIPPATATVVRAGAVLDASATESGNGGNVVAWSDVNNPDSVTRAYGTFLARGGTAGGDGGRIETSGHRLDVEGIRVDTGASRGKAGMWLIDPSDITISNAGGGTLIGGVYDPGGASGSISPATILAGLASGDVTIQTSGGSGGNGDITVVDSIATTGDLGAARILTLTADRNIVFNSGIGIDATTGGNTQALDIALTGNGIALADASLKSPLGTVTLNATSAASITESATTVISADKLLLSGAGATYTLTSGTHTVNTLAADTGSVAYVDSDALSIGTVGASSGIAATGTVSIATASGDLTVAQNVSTTDATSAAVELNAGAATAAGTATGGDIILSGSPSVSIGAGGRATLFTGSVSGSTGVTSLVGSGSGAFRYNSDESASNFTAALGAGRYAVYREQPTATITANNQILTYGTAPTLTSTVSGLQNGDTSAQAVSSAPVSVGGSTSTSGNYIVGSHTLTPSGAVGGLGYAFAYANGTLTVNQKALNVTYTGIDKVYDGTTSASVTLSDDRETGDLLSVSHSEVFATDKNAGTAKTIDVTGVSLSGADSGNYTVAATGSATADITPRTLNVTYTGLNKVYDGTTAAVVSTSDDRVAGDTFTINRTADFSPDKTVGVGKTINVTGVSLSGTDAGNYTAASTGTTSANITTRTLNVTYTGVDREYDGTTTAAVNTGDDRVTGDSLIINRTATFAPDKNVGAGKTVNVTGVTLSGTDSSNYSVSPTGSTTADILPKTLTLAATAADKVYDGGTVATVTGYGLSGFVGSETVTAGSTSATFSDKNVGTAKTVTINGITLSDGSSGGLASNYSVPGTTLTTADITPRTLNVVYTGVNKVYDSTITGVVTTADDRVAGDDLTIDNNAEFSDKNVGVAKVVSISGVSLSGTDAGNYTVATTGTAAADITAKALTASYIADDKVYDGTTAAVATGSSSDIIVGDTVTFSETAAFSDKDVGTGKAVSVSGITLGGTDAGNYALQNSTAATTADIIPKTLSLSPEVANKIYDGTTAATVTNYNLGGFVGAETVIVTSSTATFDSRNVGAAKPVTISGITLADGSNGGLASNYSAPATVTATADITPNPYASNVTSSVTSSSTRINGTSSKAFIPGKELDRTAGPGAGTHTIAMADLDLFAFGRARTAATTALTLTVDGDASPVSFATMGTTVTLYLGTADADINWPLSTILPTFILKDGGGLISADTYNVVDNGSSLTLTTGFSSQGMPVMGDMKGPGTMVTLSLKGDTSSQLAVTLNAEGTLLIKIKKDSVLSQDDRTVVLLGLAAAKQQLHENIDAISSVVIQK